MTKCVDSADWWFESLPSVQLAVMTGHQRDVRNTCVIDEHWQTLPSGCNHYSMLRRAESAEHIYVIG